MDEGLIALRLPTSNLLQEYVLGHPKDQHNQTSTNAPKREQPKAQPPDSLRDKVPLYGKLPKYSGPYGVGILDIVVAVEKPQIFSHIRREHVHLLVLETVLLTVYYPAQHDTGTRSDSGTQKLSRPTWLSRSRAATKTAYVRFASLPRFSTMLFMLATSWFTKLPAYRHARNAEHWPPYDNKGGTRAAYSTLCGEFASHGFIVGAVEHRDGSGSRSIVNHAKEGLASRAEREEVGDIEHTKSSKRHEYDRVDFIFSRDNKYDTSPTHQIDRELRNAQVDMRLAEIEEAYKVMTTICLANGAFVAARNLRFKGATGATSDGLSGVDWKIWKGRLHTDHVPMVGHSLGSTTTIEVLRHTDRFNYVEAGIVYDLWGMSVRSPDDDPSHHIHVPVLGINSEAFMYWDANFDVARSICKEAQNSGPLAWLMTVRGTVQISQSDFCI